MKKHIAVLCFILLCIPALALAEGLPTVTLGFGESSGGPQQVSTALQFLFALTVLSMAPAILLMTTSFTRIAIVLAIVRQSMGTQQMPPNQVLIGLALFLTFFIMSPVFNEINSTALQPYLNGELTQKEAIELGSKPLRNFMFAQAKEEELGLLMEISGKGVPETHDDVPTSALIPAFMLSELKRAFQMGFLIYIPFLVIDMVVASVLLSMGMMMLPPVIISLPFKLLFFVLVDGWGLIVGSLVKSFY